MMQFNKIKLSFIIISVVIITSSFKKSITSELDKSSFDKSLIDTSKNAVNFKYTIHGKLVSDREIDSVVNQSIKETLQKIKKK